ncbi:hypothetical protein JK359_37515 [Streptomyces actinomycinicus]|uniref:Uncharacterized protein n=1 Tax=Streptomyces actinomycinicus TaxID=1695166 RepID=A0A937EQ97_9ACTN|nr:hypothetical protein [Streptomyces actinomycinicus]MBL1087573.1 hypothetical protein [Streptomyces actinomycinicus]
MPDAVLLSVRRASAAGTAARQGHARAATAELRRRHFPAMLAYARLCADQTFARVLAAEALEQALLEPGVPFQRAPWQHHLLTLVHRTAVEWARAGHTDRLSCGLLSWLAAHHALGPVSGGGVPEHDGALLAAFRRLPETTRAAVWHTVVLPGDTVCGGRPSGGRQASVPVLRDRALEDFRRTYLDVFADRVGDGPCRLLVPLIDLATRGDGTPHSCDLEEHIAHCPDCCRARRDLLALTEHPARTLADGLLPWGGTTLVSPERGDGAPVPPGTTPAARRISTFARKLTTPDVLAPAGLLIVILLIRALPMPATLYSTTDPAPTHPPSSATAAPNPDPLPPAGTSTPPATPGTPVHPSAR